MDFIDGIILGYALVVPMGPINVLIISYALTSVRLAVPFGLGAFSADMVYFLLVNLGVLAFANNPLVMKILAILGALILSYMAFGILKGAKKPLQIKKDAIPHNEAFKMYLKGIGLGFSNPYAITFWIGIAALSATHQNPALLILGFIISSLSWLVFLPLTVNKSRKFINQTVMKWFAYFSFVILLFFAVKLLYQNFII
ncbi:MAG: LysE family translocator [Campylobacter sp.]|nr:LysE family translocator [Campylobacter sp.]